MSRTHALILAAGRGERFGAEVPKQLQLLDGRPVLVYAVEAFLAALIDSITVVTRQDLVGAVEGIAGPLGANVIVGGASRADSARAGLAYLDAGDDDIVLIHDGARPLVQPETIQRCVAGLDEADAVTVAAPTTDTMLEVELGTVVEVPARSRMFRAQTPQAFRFALIRDAHAAAAADPDFFPTDDCGVVHRFRPDVEIHVVMGTPANIKITTPEDLDRAQRLIDQSR